MTDTVRRSAAVLAALCVVPALVRAQSGAQTLLLRAHLGGDSAQATTVPLRRGATYRISVVPASAELQLKSPPHDTTPARVLDRRALEPGDSVPGGEGFEVVAPLTGDHLVELAGERRAPVLVEVRLLRLAGGDHIPTTNGDLVYSFTASSDLPNYVDLDSGVVYRVQALTDVLIEPRSMGGAPVRLSPQVRTNGVGVPFIPAWPGTYRVWADGSVDVRIYRTDFDQTQIECIRHPGKPGCLGREQRRYSPWTTAIKVATFVVAGIVIVEKTGNH